MKILLMEDDPVLGEIIADYLQQYYNVERVFDSAGAQERIDTTHFDLLILDIGLRSTRKELLRRVAVRVPMVAGLEVVNERLFGRQLPEKIRKGLIFKPRYVDIRDEEVRFFGDLPSAQLHYYLQVRATFRYQGEMPPSRAEVMYRPWIYGIGEPVKLQVK